ncbi:class I SAM-dependent methyltransferase [Saccharomonospora sp. CUA-673]|uniref:class I SAM-dependent methyltransferase n=1 Tax=Saccharomonospora sp. CUA-673 TaxID=1904969 RepID=UPI002101A9AD|nr:methyltransferase domain-containing protein [Saccharomonospora sp. CUA-673]
MLTALPEGGDPVVVELGPGTGAFTEPIQRRLDGRGRHIAIELNPTMSEHLARRCPNVEVVTDVADNLPAVLADRGLSGADYVVSGLPWSAFTGSLIDTIAGAMSPAGIYTQFTYTWTRWAPPAKRQLHELREAFDDVAITPTVWRNLPPAFVYVSRLAPA